MAAKSMIPSIQGAISLNVIGAANGFLILRDDKKLICFYLLFISNDFYGQVSQFVLLLIGPHNWIFHLHAAIYLYVFSCVMYRRSEL